MNRLIAIVGLVLAAPALPAIAAEADKADNLNNYLVGITGGAVSASGLVGLDKGPTQIETSQDIIVALQPLASGNGKSAFGLAITPARTTITPMAGSTYVKNDFWRLLGSVTLSYAQNGTTVANVDYLKSAFSLGTVYYFEKAQDPVHIGNTAFRECLTDAPMATKPARACAPWSRRATRSRHRLQLSRTPSFMPWASTS